VRRLHISAWRLLHALNAHYRTTGGLAHQPDKEDQARVAGGQLAYGHRDGGGDGYRDGDRAQTPLAAATPGCKCRAAQPETYPPCARWLCAAGLHVRPLSATRKLRHRGGCRYEARLTSRALLCGSGAQRQPVGQCTLAADCRRRACAQLGGLGFLHYNMTTGEQLAQALRVKRHAPGFVVSPAVLGPQATVAEYDALRVRRAAAVALPVTWVRVGLLSRRALTLGERVARAAVIKGSTACLSQHGGTQSEVGWVSKTIGLQRTLQSCASRSGGVVRPRARVCRPARSRGLTAQLEAAQCGCGSGPAQGLHRQLRALWRVRARQGGRGAAQPCGEVI
jgi:hypothetical protein